MADWQAEARQTAQRVGIDPDLFVALVRQESGGNQGAISASGAIGRTQLMPGTAKSLGVDPYNAGQNLYGGALYLKQQLQAFGGNRAKALAAYNAGPGAVQKYGGIPPFAQTQQYVKNILGSLGKSGSPASPAGPPAPQESAQTGNTGVSTLTSDPGSNPTAAAALLASLSSSRRQPIQTSALAPPANTPGPALPDAYKALSASRGPAPRQDVSSLLSLVQTQGATMSPAPASPTSSVPGDLPASAVPGKGHALPTGTESFDGKPVAAWIAPALQYARAHGWKGTVNSGYRSYADQKRIYDSGVRPAAKPGTSNHEGDVYPRGAVDVTQAQQLAQILAGSPYRKRLIWAGSKDPVHFSHPHDGGY